MRTIPKCCESLKVCLFLWLGLRLGTTQLCTKLNHKSQFFLLFLAFLVGSMHKTQPQPQKQTHLHLVIAFLRIDHLFKFKLLLLLIIILHLGLGQLPPLYINLVLKVETWKPELEVICEFLKQHMKESDASSILKLVSQLNSLAFPNTCLKQLMVGSPTKEEYQEDQPE